MCSSAHVGFFLPILALLICILSGAVFFLDWVHSPRSEDNVLWVQSVFPNFVFLIAPGFVHNRQLVARCVYGFFGSRIMGV